MAVLEFLVYDLLSQAGILIGLLALIGLVLQKKPADKVISGTIKTIVGFLIFGIGSTAAQGALTGLQTLFTEAFGLQGVTPISEAITAQAQTLFPTVIAWIMIGGFACNLLEVDASLGYPDRCEGIGLGERAEQFDVGLSRSDLLWIGQPATERIPCGYGVRVYGQGVVDGGPNWVGGGSETSGRVDDRLQTCDSGIVA